jgi:hypothetical protein
MEKTGVVGEDRLWHNFLGFRIPIPVDFLMRSRVGTWLLIQYLGRVATGRLWFVNGRKVF